MRQKKTKEMLQYWMGLYEQANSSNSAFQKRRFPERSDVQPADCRALLGDMFILEVKNKQVFYRLAGTRLCSLYGRELKNESFQEAFEGEDQRSAETLSAQMGSDGVAAIICSVAESSHGELVNLETLLLPLTYQGNPSQRVLGVTVACEMPSWIGAHPIIAQTIRSVRTLTPWAKEDENIAPPLSDEAVLDGYFPNSDSFSIRERLNTPSMQTDFKSSFAANNFDPHLSDGEINGEFKPARMVGHLQIIDGGRED